MPQYGPLNFRRHTWRRLELTFSSESSFSSAFGGTWTLRNQDAPVGEGTIGSGGASELHEAFRRLGFEVSFSYSPSRG